MLKVKIFLVADRVIRDAETNNISIIDIVEQFGVPGFPLFIPQIVAFALIEREKDDPQNYELEMKILFDEQELNNVLVKVDFEDKLRNRSIVTINGLVIPNPGLLKFAYFHNGSEIISYQLKAEKIGQPEITAISE